MANEVTRRKFLKIGLANRRAHLRMVLLGTAIAALAATRSLGDTGADLAPRRYLQGFTPFPFDMTMEAVHATDQFVAKNGDLVAIHFDGGVPWTEALAARPFAAGLTADWARHKETCRGKRVLLSLTPLDGDRKELALYRGEKENQPLPEAFRGKDLDDPRRGARLRALLPADRG